MACAEQLPQSRVCKHYAYDKDTFKADGSQKAFVTENWSWGSQFTLFYEKYTENLMFIMFLCKLNLWCRGQETKQHHGR